MCVFIKPHLAGLGLLTPAHLLSQLTNSAFLILLKLIQGISGVLKSLKMSKIQSFEFKALKCLKLS